MTGRFPRASTSADASGARRRRGHPTDPAQPPSSSPARLFAPRRSRPRSSSVSRARRDGMPRPPRTELRGRNGAPIFLRSQFPRQEDVAPIARFPTRAHRAERKVCDSRKTLARAAVGTENTFKESTSAAARAPTRTPATPPSSSPPPSPRAAPIPRASRRSFVSSAQTAKVSSREKQNRPRSGPCRARTPVGSRRAFRNGTEFPKRREGDRSSPRAAWPAMTRARPRPPSPPRAPFFPGVKSNAVTNATTCLFAHTTRAPIVAEDASRAARDANVARVRG